MSAWLQYPWLIAVWIGVLLLPWLPVVKLCFQRGFIHRLCLFPRAMLALAAGFLASLVASIALVVFAPQAALVLTALVALLSLFLFGWRARDRYGWGRGLPPGKLTLAPTGPWVDYLTYRHHADRFGEIYKMSHFLRPMVCIVSLPLAAEFLARHEEDTDTPPMPFNRMVPGGFMRYMAPELHRTYRARMKRLFHDADILQQHAAHAAQEFRTGLASLARHDAPVHPHSCIEQMTFSVLADLFFGISSGTSSFQRFRAAYQAIDYRKALRTPAPNVRKALAEIEALVLAESTQRQCLFALFVNDSRTANPDDMPADPGRKLRADDPTLLRNFIFLLLTSWIDVADLLTWVFKFLAGQPKWIESVRQQMTGGMEAAGSSAELLARNVILETLRLEQSEYLMRRAKRDIEFRGFRIPRNWLVRICVRECHLDPTHFENPREFNPDRFRAGPPTQLQYSPFGLHNKSCLGVAITLWAGQKFVIELARLGNWRVDRDGPRELGAFHWRPSQHFRVSAPAGPG